MIQISIKKQDVVTNSATFLTLEEGQEWLSRHEGMGTFGAKASTREISVEIAPAVIDEEGTELVPALVETRTEEIPGYVVVIEDLTAKLEQDKINAEAKALLDSTDWMVIRQLETGTLVPQDVLDARAAARASIIK